MNPSINAEREILAGMEEAAYAKAARGGIVAEAVWKAIDERKARIRRMEAQHERSHGGRQCRCRAHEHGGDCMCFE